MKQLILVDSVNIGNFTFQGYILQCANDQVAYGIYIDTLKNPLVCFKRDSGNTVGLQIDEGQVEYISKTSKASLEEREHYFNTFLNFVIESEKKAAYMAFKGEKMEYLSNSKYLVQIRTMYLAYATTRHAPLT